MGIIKFILASLLLLVVFLVEGHAFNPFFELVHTETKITGYSEVESEEQSERTIRVLSSIRTSSERRRIALHIDKLSLFDAAQELMLEDIIGPVELGIPRVQARRSISSGHISEYITMRMSIPTRERSPVICSLMIHMIKRRETDPITSTIGSIHTRVTQSCRSTSKFIRSVVTYDLSRGQRDYTGDLRYTDIVTIEKIQ